MNMVRRYRSGDDFCIFFGADSADEISGSDCQFAFENFVAVFGYPGDVDLEVEYGMR